jgi:transcriptional regulator with XRE-family HTH domain
MRLFIPNILLTIGNKGFIVYLWMVILMGLDLINILKKQKGLTSEELAKLSGVPIGTLNKILNGQSKNPQLETLAALARVLECSIDDFDTSFNNNFAIDPAARQLLEERKVLASKSSKATLEQLKQMNKIMDALFGEKDYDD